MSRKKDHEAASEDEGPVGEDAPEPRSKLMEAVEEIVEAKNKLCQLGMEEGRALDLVCRVYEMQLSAKASAE